MSQARDTDRDWTLVAERQPYWGVLSADDYRGEELSETQLKSFFDTGERAIANLFGAVAHYFDGPFTPSRSLDFGCGVGRLLIPIAKRSREAVGVDVAPRMLELCKMHATEADITNIVLVAGDDNFSGIEGTFDFINTYIVLQHIPQDRGYAIIGKLIERLEKGGTCVLHTTYAKARSFLVHETGAARFYRREGRVIRDIVPADQTSASGTITMFDYDLNEIFAMISLVAGSPVVVFPTNDDQHLGVQIVFRRAS